MHIDRMEMLTSYPIVADIINAWRHYDNNGNS